jgi:hypothetical protein
VLAKELQQASIRYQNFVIGVLAKP